MTRELDHFFVENGHFHNFVVESDEQSSLWHHRNGNKVACQVQLRTQYHRPCRVLEMHPPRFRSFFHFFFVSVVFALPLDDFFCLFQFDGRVSWQLFSVFFEQWIDTDHNNRPGHANSSGTHKRSDYNDDRKFL